MSSNQFPSETPNVGISNPSYRKVIGAIGYGAGVLVGAVALADSLSPAFDVSAYTVPAAAVIAFLLGSYGFGATLPNIPKK